MTSGSRYVLGIAFSAAFILAGIWYYAKSEAIAFMESGYAVWKAKETLVATCDFGSDVFLGDSQSDSAIVPLEMTESATNLALAGGTPIESYFLLQRILACPNQPHRVFLSFGIESFQHIQPFLWESAVRYRVFGMDVLREISETAKKLADPSYARVETRDGNRGVLRDLIYGYHLPSIYFSALIEGRFFMRRSQNLARLAEVIHARGYPNYGQGANANGIPAASFGENFNPLPLQVHYFEAMLGQLEGRNITVYFLITPIEKSRKADVSAIAHYRKFLTGIQRRHANLYILQSKMPFWDSRMFVDGYHLSYIGAQKFTALLERCLATRSASRSDCSFALN